MLVHSIYQLLDTYLSTTRGTLELVDCARSMVRWVDDNSNNNNETNKKTHATNCCRFGIQGSDQIT